MNETLERIQAHKVTNLREFVPSGSLPILELLKIDREKNYHGNQPNSNYTYLNLFKYVNSGNDLYRCGNTLYITDDLPDNGLEFHALNAERAGQFSKNSVEMFDLFKTMGYKYLLTYYDFPIISELLAATKFDTQIDKVDEGIHRKYRAKVRL
jgi:hypothetical protein